MIFVRFGWEWMGMSDVQSVDVNQRVGMWGADAVEV